MMSEPLTYSLMEAADLLGISRNGIYNAAKTNALPVPVLRVGKRILVSRAELHKHLELNPKYEPPDETPPLDRLTPQAKTALALEACRLLVRAKEHKSNGELAYYLARRALGLEDDE
jgi:excisionase family DNA binding protein